MASRRPLHLPLSLRVFVLAVFALGLVLQPVFASLGELHELTHVSAATHAAQTDHADNIDDEWSVAESSAPAPDDMLHFLMHHVHCCGQSAMAALQAVRVTPFATGPSCPALPEAQRPLQAPSLAPFRPPILA